MNIVKISTMYSTNSANQTFNKSSTRNLSTSGCTKRANFPLKHRTSTRGQHLKVYSVLADRPKTNSVEEGLEKLKPNSRTTKQIHPHPLQDGNAARSPAGHREDPWKDEKWAKTQWTVYRGVAYDLTEFLEKHPGGNWLVNLSLKRDCTGLFESYHMRPEVAGAPFKRLPQIPDFPIEAVPRAPYPNDSDLYNNIRNRVRAELFDGAKNGEHRTGSEWAAMCVLGFACLSFGLYLEDTSIFSGAMLGAAGAWIGLTIQHCGNHGAMSTKPWFNNMLGLCNDLIGGSSLAWRYHHQVSHHIHCNDTDMDEDVYSTFPALRNDKRLPKYWFHKYQHIYQWAIFPLMHFAFEYGDIKTMLTQRTAGASIHGADWKELASVPVGKFLHYGGLLLPLALGASGGDTAAAIASYAFMQGFILAPLFVVSHNIDEAKNIEWLETDRLRNDWAVQQILTSANWGSTIGCFFTGGLNLQIEHHLFPAVSFMHYPAISKIVQEEAQKVGVPYNQYKWLPPILAKYQQFMKETGNAPAPPGNDFPKFGGMGSQHAVIPVVETAKNN